MSNKPIPRRAALKREPLNLALDLWSLGSSKNLKPAVLLP